ncbi:MAG: MarR family winged helix-turn-helix transcriptional regulator [Beijerinckiaceae bacterium]|nr:MarR family winged helix-turn-helix transcriptional regulator [Beijerinckiaceae bacterium]
MNAMLHQKRGGNAQPQGGGQPAAEASTPPDATPTPAYDLIELLFFAYRDFVGDADRLLESIKFGRAHHRVLHFVQRHPGLTIAELLDILRITKQSLNRVLKELLDSGYVEAHPGENDRRQRQLCLTDRGHKLAMDLAILQSRRFARALQELPEGSRRHAEQLLLAMIDPHERSRVEALVRSGVFPHI